MLFPPRTKHIWMPSSRSRLHVKTALVFWKWYSQIRTFGQGGNSRRYSRLVESERASILASIRVHTDLHGFSQGQIFCSVRTRIDGMSALEDRRYVEDAGRSSSRDLQELGRKRAEQPIRRGNRQLLLRKLPKLHHFRRRE